MFHDEWFDAVSPTPWRSSSSLELRKLPSDAVVNDYLVKALYSYRSERHTTMLHGSMLNFSNLRKTVAILLYRSEYAGIIGNSTDLAELVYASDKCMLPQSPGTNYIYMWMIKALQAVVFTCYYWALSVIVSTGSTTRYIVEGPARVGCRSKTVLSCTITTRFPSWRLWSSSSAPPSTCTRWSIWFRTSGSWLCSSWGWNPSMRRVRHELERQSSNDVRAT